MKDYYSQKENIKQKTQLTIRYRYLLMINYDNFLTKDILP